MFKKILPILLILLLAFVLRSYRLSEIPPGLTHDEANHGREAIEILDGMLRYYFPLNYGSEPLYSYTVAGMMAVLGENLLALRLVNVVFGVAAIGAVFVWAQQAFKRRVALLTAVLIAISFWPLASSREALRAGMLPFFMTVAVWFFWQIIAPDEETQPSSGKRQIWLVLGFALSVVATLHIYLAARVVWLVFPIFLFYLGLFHRKIYRTSWKPVLLGLLLAGLLIVPMFVYLANNPASQTRLSMLDGPLKQISRGQLLPILQNASEAFLAFIWTGFGDQFLAYNIPGRAVFDGVTAVLFIIGILLCIWHWRRPAYAFLLLWFLIGIIPSLVTGSTAGTTRNLAALPAVFLLPSVGFVFTTEWIINRFKLPQNTVFVGLAVVWLLFAGFVTGRDYFWRWGEAPEVRGAYQQTLVNELAYLKQMDTAVPTIMSTVYPGAAHDTSIARVLAAADAQDMRWVDARYGFAVPPTASAQALIPASTPPHRAFASFLRPVETINLRPDDLDPTFTLYAVDADVLQTRVADKTAVSFNGALALLDTQWLTETTEPGATAELLTIWRIEDPTLAGQLHPPTDATDVRLFTHVLNSDGSILTQRDALDAPSWSWQQGDLILQVHPMRVPTETMVGHYKTAVGIYDAITGERLTILNADGARGESHLIVTPLQVAKPAN